MDGEDLMIPLDIILDGEGCWSDLVGSASVVPGELKAVALLEGGMQSGKASVSFRIHLPDGKVVIAETSLSLLIGATRAFTAKTGQNE